MSTKLCCGTSVGVLVTDEQNRYLLIERATLPVGMAPVAGHALDEHPSYETAARTEVAEEVGLAVTRLIELPIAGFHPGRCRRRVPHGRAAGHIWKLYEASVAGELSTSPREVRGARWVTAADLQELAERTAAHARGLLTTAAFTANPGLEPVWCEWMHLLGIIRLPEVDLERIRALAAAEPTRA